MKTFLSLLPFLLSGLLSGCAHNTNEKDGSNASADSISVRSTSSDTLFSATDAAAATHPKLVKTASITFKVTDVEQGARSVSALAQHFGGRIFHQSLEAGEGERSELKIAPDSLLVISSSVPQASLTARVPSDSLEAFLYSVADLGYFTGSSRLDIDDKSLAYLENRLRQQNREVFLAQPVKMQRSFSGGSRALGLRDEITDRIIANKAIDADVQFSTVSLSLYQNPVIRKEVIANYVLSDYRLSFGQRFAHALGKGWEAFLTLVLAMAHLWIFILLGLIGFFAWRFIGAKRKLAGMEVKVS